MSDDRFHDWDAAYVLGLLGSHDRRAFEDHLATCAACTDGVAELAGMPGILATLSTAEAVGLDDGVVDDLREQGPAPDLVMHLVTAARKRRRRVRLATAIAAVAAAAVVGIGGFVAGSAKDTSSSAGGPPFMAMAATQPSAMTADLRVEPKTWGTRFDWSCHYKGDAKGWEGHAASRYELVVTEVSGTETTVATWSATGPKDTTLAASNSVPTSQIRRIEIRVAGQSKPLTSTTL